MLSSDRKALSKYLSLVLRHEPAAANVTLDPAGWVEVEALIAGAARAGHSITRHNIEEVVTTSEKQRFTLSADGLRLRAAQGHSIAVDLGLAQSIPPATLFHGTARASLEAILSAGLSPQGRQHVHLSSDAETARLVGQRHGAPVVLQVLARTAYDDGQLFWLAENGVWLTGPVAPRYLMEGAAP